LDTIKLSFIGDIHWGAAQCNKKLLKACVRMIADDPTHWWLGMGDYVDAICPDDKRQDFRSLDPETKLKELNDLPKKQIREIVSELEPIKERCLGLLTGNHEEKIATKYYTDIHSDLCLHLGVKNLGYSAFVNLKFPRLRKDKTESVLICAHHGFGGGRKKGSKVNRIEDFAASFPYCDIYAMGHVHETISFVSTVLKYEPISQKIISKPRAFVVSGTFLETYTKDFSGYGERMMYPPTSLGISTIIIKPHAESGKQISLHTASNGLPA
jgi:hypothetical protein